jgi:heme-degrading monooxygenase HmoA
MILEHALLTVRAGQETAFEAAFGTAKAVIAGAAGFRRLSMSRCVERPGTYLLLVEWESLEDHLQGFRASAGYDVWRKSLHHFYDPFPVVEHFQRVDGVEPGASR